jgi:hypothetical protein
MSDAYERFVRALEAKGCRHGRQLRCPAHQDDSPSLSLAEGDDGRVLVTCHAGCETEDIVAALGLRLVDLFNNDRGSQMSTPVATYDYRDEQGALLYQVCRFPSKRFGVRQPAEKGEWKWNVEDVRRVLYKLPELLTQPEAQVFVVEGEKDADRLCALDLVATTNPMGAGKWRDEYSTCLRNRDVVILPDNDTPGHQHADDVARSLTGIASSIKILELPGLLEKGDVSDWLMTHSKQELLTLVADAPVYVGEQGALHGTRGEDESHKGGGGRQSLAKQLIPIVIDLGVELFHDQRGDTFAAVPIGRGRRIVSLRSRALSDWLSQVCWKQLARALGSEQRASVCNTLSGIAAYDGPLHELHVRCADYEGAFWMDLDGQRAVRVEPGKWEIVEQPPIMFRWFPHQRPLPDPVPGGDPALVLSFVNLRDDGDRVLFLVYSVVGCVPSIPIAVLVLHGIQGCTKTTMLKIIKALLDPSAVAVRGGVHDQSEFALAAFHNRVLFFDNLTSVPDWLSDALCRAATGEGWSKRTLYTDDDATVLEYRGLVGLAGINLVAERADLLDRSLIMELAPISPNERREERELWDQFEIARPQIFGGLLDALSRAMQVEPGIMLRSKPRMADFARWGAAAAVGLHLNPGDFLRAYARNVERQNEAAVVESPVAQAVLAFMAGRDRWQGTPASLYEKLDVLAAGASVDTRSKRWPRSASWLSRRLREVEPNLLAMGIEVEIAAGRTAGSREITVTALPSSGANAVTV